MCSNQNTPPQETKYVAVSLFEIQYMGAKLQHFTSYECMFLIHLS